MGLTTDVRAQLKARFFPFMTERGFIVDLSEGPMFWTFRKMMPAQVYVCTIQFEKSGLPRFVLTVGSCGSDGVECFGQHIPAERVLPHDTPDHVRLQPRRGPYTKSWFRSDLTWWEKIMGTTSHNPVEELLRLFSEVESYWQTGQIGPHLIRG